MSEPCSTPESSIHHMPCWIDLTPNGKTLVIIFLKGESEERLAELFIEQLGEPEEIGVLDYPPHNSFLLFPHQNMNETLKGLAEQMTTESLLKYLGMPEYKCV